MSLRDTLKQIVALQELGQEIRRNRSDREALFRDLDEHKRLIEQLHKQREDLKQQRLQGQKRADSLDLRSREVQEQNAKFQVQLNTTKRQTDYDVIRHSILSNKADISRIEDEELELLQRIDELHRQEAEAANRLAAEEEKLRQAEGEVAAQAAEYDRRTAELEAHSGALLKQIDERVLAAYQRLEGAWGGRALVSVRNRICLGCHTMITKQSENELQRDRSIVYCHSCGRILMLVDEEVPGGAGNGT